MRCAGSARTSRPSLHLGVLAGYDADLAAEATRLTNRLHAALLHVHPALERLLGKHFRRRGVLSCSPPPALRPSFVSSARTGCGRSMMARSRRLAVTLPAQILAALDEQTVVDPSDRAVRPGHQRGRRRSCWRCWTSALRVAGELDALLAEHPLAEVLTSMPGVGAADRGRAAAAPSGDGSTFATAGHLAAYAGLAPVTRQSGRTIRGESQPRRGNRALKSALYFSAFASLKHPTSRAYYDRKRAEGKYHTGCADSAWPAGASTSCYAMVRDRRPYQSDQLTSAPAAGHRSQPRLDGVIGTLLCQDAVGRRASRREWSAGPGSGLSEEPAAGLGRPRWISESPPVPSRARFLRSGRRRR